MGAGHNAREKLRMDMGRVLIKTDATVSLTVKEVLEYGIIIANHASGIAITLPAAAASMAGCLLFIGSKGAGNLTVVVAAGFGGIGSGGDTGTYAAIGDAGLFFCTGSFWYNVIGGTAT